MDPRANQDARGIIQYTRWRALGLTLLDLGSLLVTNMQSQWMTNKKLGSPKTVTHRLLKPFA